MRTYFWKNMSIDFVIRLPVLMDWKSEKFNLILVIVNQLTKMIYYKLVKVTIDTSKLEKVIINVIMQYHSLLD